MPIYAPYHCDECECHPMYSVNSIEQFPIVAIPMTGEPVFVLDKESDTIYAKRWNNDGNIITTKYCKVSYKPEQTHENAVEQDIIKRLSKIEHDISLIKSSTDYQARKKDRNFKKYKNRDTKSSNTYVVDDGE